MDTKELIELVEKFEAEKQKSEQFREKPKPQAQETRTLTWDAKRDFYKEYDDTYMPWVGVVCHGKNYTTTEEENKEIFLNKPKDI